MATSPNWKLRRLASRALRVLDRHGDRTPALAAYRHNLQPAAMAYIQSYDRLRTVETARIHEVAQGKAVVDELLAKLRSWSGQVAASKAVAGFDVSAYGDTPEVVDDVIADAESFVETVTEHRTLNPEAMPYVEALLEDMNTSIDHARREWVEAEGLKSEYQLLVKENRANAQNLSDLLIGFRRSLSAVLGSDHPDYQSLRASKIDRTVLAEGEAEDLPPSLIPPPESPTSDPSPEDSIPG